MPLYYVDTNGNTVVSSPASLGSLSGGSGDKSYTHNQSAPATTWTINHNLGKNPSVSLVDTAGTQVFGSVHYVSSTQLTVTFSVAFSGTAYLN